jgi:hypothetical protein
MQWICSRKGKINKIAKPYEILGFMIILKSTSKSRRAARNAGSNYPTKAICAGPGQNIIFPTTEFKVIRDKVWRSSSWPWDMRVVHT